MRVLELQGTPAQMGEAFGEACRAEIAELYALRLENALLEAARYGRPDAGEAELLRLTRSSLPRVAAFDAAGHAELVGIARGAGMAAERVLAMNGLTDFRDALAFGAAEGTGGCTAFLVQADASADGRVWAGQTWDLATANQPYVLAVRRRPREGLATLCVTTVGCLSLMGMNEAGLALGTTNLRTLDARPGVPYLSLIHRALGFVRVAEAARCIAGALRAGGHSYWLADAAGSAAILECTATRSRLRPLRHGWHVQTNHCQVPEHRALEAETPGESSRARLQRMGELLREREGRLDAATLRSLLADEAGGELAICRQDSCGISSNAGLVVSPQELELWACQGPPCGGAWRQLSRALAAAAQRSGKGAW